MMMRHELKFAMPAERIGELRRRIRAFTSMDAFALSRPERQYTVRSIYLDTRHLDAFRQKDDGVAVRRKLRIRGYDEPEGARPTFLEIKWKLGDVGGKDRAPVRFSDLPRLFARREVGELVLPGGSRTRSFDGLRRFLYHAIRAAVAPAVLVVYEREAFTGRLDPSLRITFDKHLRCLARPALGDLYRERGLLHIAPRFCIVEVKFDHGFPTWLRGILGSLGLVRSSISKYSHCIVACRKDGMLFPGEMCQADLADGLTAGVGRP